MVLFPRILIDRSPNVAGAGATATLYLGYDFLSGKVFEQPGNDLISPSYSKVMKSDSI